MKALVLEEYMKLVYRDVPDPEPGPGEVLIRVRACGICGSDVHGLDGSSGRRIPPLIMGHEASGEIAALGPGVTGWRVGERVTFDSTIYCGECFYCQRGQINLCDNRRVLGVSCADYRQHGAFAELVVVPTRILYRLPEGLTFERAAMLEAVSIALHGVGRVPLEPGSTVVVVGAGMIGLLVIQSLRALGDGLTVIAVDIDESRLTLARRLGADRALNSGTQDVVAEVLAATDGRGAAAAFEVVGLSPTFNLAVGCVRKGGALGLVGNLAATVDMPLQAVVTRELSLYGSCSSAGEYPAGLDLIVRGAIDVDALISAVAPLSEGARWFERLYAREPGLMKVILVNQA